MSMVSLTSGFPFGNILIWEMNKNEMPPLWLRLLWVLAMNEDEEWLTHEPESYYLGEEE